jgi:hypothetical protein
LNITAPGVRLGSYGVGQHILDGSEFDAGYGIVRIGAKDVTLDGVTVVACGRTGRTCTAAIYQGKGDTSGANIRGCVVQGTPARSLVGVIGINMAGRAPFTIEGNTISGVTVGIRLDDVSEPSRGGTVRGNVIRENNKTFPGDSDGILLLSSTRGAVNFRGKLIIEENRISEYNENGIDIAGASGVVVRRNVITSHVPVSGSGVIGAAILVGGVTIPSGADDAITENYIRGVPGGTGIQFRDSARRNLVANNQVVGAGYCMFGGGARFFPQDNTFINNTCLDNTKGGVRITGGQGYVIKNNLFVNGPYAILADGQSRGIMGSNAWTTDGARYTDGWLSLGGSRVAVEVARPTQFPAGIIADAVVPAAGSSLCGKGACEGPGTDLAGRERGCPRSVGAFEGECSK